MIIVGIDPGTTRIGWSVIETNNDNPRLLDFGVFTPKGTHQIERLKTIFAEVTKLIKRFKPDYMAIEELFFSKNAKTAISVGEARGVILLTAAQVNLPVVSYTPRMVKLSICGTGSADKKQIQKMVMTILHLSHIPASDDAADAIAIALTCCFSYKFKKRLI